MLIFNAKPGKKMKAKEIQTRQTNLFRNQFINLLNLEHELVKLAEIIPWNMFEESFGTYYSETQGRPRKPIRLMVSLLMLQHMHNLSDEKVLKIWAENAYFQYFSGYEELQWVSPADATTLVKFRKKIGPRGMEKIFESTVITALNSGFVSEKECENVIVDTTVMEKNITYPTDSKLYQRAISRLGKLSKKHQVTLKQSYKYVSKKAMGKSHRYAHAKQYKRMKNSNKKLKTYLGRLTRDIERKIAGTEKAAYFQEELAIVNRLLQQESKSKNKIYSMHEPEASCISKGKAHKKYEYGSKVSIAITHKQGLALSTKAHPGNPYDGHTLNDVLQDVNSKIPTEVKQVFVDRGYRGHKIDYCEVFISGQRKGMTPALKRKLKRRSAIEPHIGHMKSEGKLRRNTLKGQIGDEINAILCGIGHNLRLLLAWIAWLFCACVFLSCRSYFSKILKFARVIFFSK